MSWTNTMKSFRFVIEYGKKISKRVNGVEGIAPAWLVRSEPRGTANRKRSKFRGSLRPHRPYVLGRPAFAADVVQIQKPNLAQ